MFCRNEFEFPRSKEVKRKSKLMLGTKKVFSLRDGRQIEIETGKLAKQARLQFEEATGTKVVTSKSSLPDFTPKKQIKKK